MHRQFRIAKWTLAVLPLLALSLGGATIALSTPETNFTLDVSARHCEQYPLPVICRANAHNAGQHYPVCYPTLCEAEAAGAYECRKNFKGTSCEIEPQAR